MAQSPSTPSNKTVLYYRNRNIMGATYVTESVLLATLKKLNKEKQGELNLNILFKPMYSLNITTTIHKIVSFTR